MSKKRRSREKLVARTLSCTSAELPCGRHIEVTPRYPGLFQLFRPLGDECEGCHIEVPYWHGAPFKPEYMKAKLEGKLIGPICKPYAYGEEDL